MKVEHTVVQVPSDVDPWLRVAKEFGYPLVALVVLVWLLVKAGSKIGAWMGPRLDEVFKALLAAQARVPTLIEENAKQSAAVLGALERQNVLLESFCDRLDESNARVEKLAEHVARLPRS